MEILVHIKTSYIIYIMIIIKCLMSALKIEKKKIIQYVNLSSVQKYIIKGIKSFHKKNVSCL